MTQQVRSIRLRPVPSSVLEASSNSIGEIFFDDTNDTLRLFTTTGSSLSVATKEWVQSSGALSGASIEVGLTPPSNPQQGNIWLDLSDGNLYVYVNDGTSSQWIQPIAGGGGAGGAGGSFSGDYNDLTNKPTIPSTLLDLGISDGVNGQVLTTNGSGSFTFTTLAPGGIQLNNLSIGSDGTPSGSGSLAYNNTNGVFTYTPPDLSTYITASALTGYATDGELAAAVANSSNWDTAYSWGDHSTQGYLTSAAAESDTLATVTARGATTTTALSVADVTSSGTITANDFVSSGAGTPQITSASTLTLEAADYVSIDYLLRLTPQSTAPVGVSAGTIAFARALGWDPLGRGVSSIYPVYYNGSSWVSFANA